MPGDDPRLAKVMKVRVRSGEVDRVVAAVRAKLRAEGRTTSTWWLGPSTTPPDLAQRLIGHGLVPIDPTTAMVATAPPVAAVDGVEVRPVRTRNDADAAAAIVAAAFEMNTATTRALAAAIREENDPPIPDSITSFLAVIDGVPVGTAASVYLDGCVGLIGGATVPSARGRGVYRSLVQARWDDAVARHRPVLVTQAVNATSRPILEHNGFTPLFPITVLLDEHP
jgi:GNAT superfamily N-acetyltransferase